MHSFDPVGFVKVPTAHTEKYREKILIYYLIENVKEKGKKEGVRERKRKRERERKRENEREKEYRQPKRYGTDITRGRREYTNTRIFAVFTNTNTNTNFNIIQE